MRRNEHAPTPVLEPGSNTVKVRVVEMDDFAIEHYSAWSSLTFTLEPDVDGTADTSTTTDMMGGWSINLSSGTHTIYARTPNGE